MEEKYYVGYIFEDTDFDAALWCDHHQDCELVEIESASSVRRFQIQAKPEPTAEEVLALAKAERAEAVASLVVEVDGMLFDGDEIAQERMARTVTAAIATGESMSATTTWVLHDNTVAQVTIRQLAAALRLAGEEQTRLWTIPYENQKEVSYYAPAEAA